MNKKIFFALYSLLPVYILWSKVYMLLYYWVVLLLIAVYMYTRPKFSNKRNSFLNAFMLLYVAFITWERTRHYKFSPTPELIVNDVEHILFAWLICLIIFTLLALKQSLALAFVKRLVITIIVFNLVGLVNEFFQNIIGGRQLFVLIPDSIKDIIMNVYGAVLFAGGAWLYKYYREVIVIALTDNTQRAAT